MTTPDPTDLPVPRSLAEQFGAILAEARDARGLSMNALARELGVSVVTLHQYEHGRGNPTLKKIDALAAQYGVHVQITRVDPPEPPQSA
jgi:transcriptional regulator with XRE-family HTH domain